ncbi:hypothetical protein PYCCODRAFT_562317 [Trametes coccinea BRFM310]|uniref:Uncharacterized protein n=1 Tax=Trametes coccinea (strain BRFM310) TaxID=1353009 RepID=A0A1Y2IIJ4_TRAC3|nr:hypothetical protein PYCCODRAFT_562317 [Trametes coccinea BRFM310]
MHRQSAFGAYGAHAVILPRKPRRSSNEIHSCCRPRPALDILRIQGIVHSPEPPGVDSPGIGLKGPRALFGLFTRAYSHV